MFKNITYNLSVGYHDNNGGVLYFLYKTTIYYF